MARRRPKEIHELSPEEYRELRARWSALRDGALGDLSLVRLKTTHHGLPAGLEGVYHFAEVVGVSVPSVLFSNGYRTTFGEDLLGRLEKVRDLSEPEALELLGSFGSSPDYGRPRRVVT